MSSADSPGGLEGVVDDVGDHADRVLEHLAAFHAQMADGLGRGRPAIDIELGLVPAVGAQMRGQDAAVGWRARLLLRLQHDGAGAVAEQHAGGAVVPVENAREGFGADHQRALERAGAQEIVGGRQRKDEARAHRLQVEGRAMGDAEGGLHGHRGGRKSVVGRRGRQHDQVDRLGVDAGIGERGLGRLDRQVGGQLAVGGDMALANAGALHDPFVGGVDRRASSALVRMRCGR